MSRRTLSTHPRHAGQIEDLGARLRAARLRRKLTQALLAERVGISLPTLRKLEAGDPSSSLATVIRVLHMLGLASDIDLLAANDALGRSLQDAELKQPRRKSVHPPSAPTGSQ